MMVPEILGEKLEEILERLWVRTVERGEPSCAPGALGEGDVEQSLAELAAFGLVRSEGGLWSLAASGRDEARNTVRRHRLAERLFTDVLAVEGELSEESACRFEHMLHRGIDEKICTLLGHPRVCPHGKPIPPGPCCAESRRAVETLVAPLDMLTPGRSGTIAYVHSTDPRRVAKLLAMGVLPGARITLIGRSPSFSFQVGYSQFAVDAEIAADINVRLDQPDGSPRGGAGFFQGLRNGQAGQRRHQHRGA
jgi:DtxR family transcriptional regulator, Mn-dependent transcriptional regulator